MTQQQNNQNQTPQVAKRPIDRLKTALYAPSIQQQFENALRDHKDAFVASVIDLYNSDSGLQECDPNALILEALKAATLKLPINKALGFSYIVKFNNSVKQADGSWLKVPTPTFIPGYKGYIQLAMRTGQYETINADVVYEGELGRRDKLTGKINFDGEKKSDKIIGYFAHFELLNGFKKTLYVELDDIAKFAKRYSPSLKGDSKISVEGLKKLAGKDPTGIGWSGNFDSMALKTVLRNLLSKYGYLSVEMQTVIADDIKADSENERDRTINTIDATVIDITNIPDQGNGNEQTAPPAKADDEPY
jgi:recombination protein RecT